MTQANLMSAHLTYGSPAYLLRNTLIEDDIDGAAWDALPDAMYLRAMTNSGWFRDTGLDIPEDATESDMLIAMRASRTLHQSDAWIRGDLINWVRTNKYNSTDIPRESLVKLADEMGVASWKRLLSNATTCNAWPMDYRHPSSELSYSHHEELAPIATLAERAAWAERCIAEGLSIRALRELLTQDAVSIDATVTQTGEAVVSFASDAFNLGIAIAAVADMIDVTMRSNPKTTPVVAIATAIEVLVKRGLVKLPPRKWVSEGLMTAATQAAQGEDDEE